MSFRIRHDIGELRTLGYDTHHVESLRYDDRSLAANDEARGPAARQIVHDHLEARTALSAPLPQSGCR